MSLYTVKLLKIGSIATGDNVNDAGTATLNPFTEAPLLPAVFFQDPNASTIDQAVSIQRIGSSQALQLSDTSGTFTLGNLGAAYGFITQTRAPNTFYSGPSSGGNAVGGFRALAAADLPTIPLNKIDISGATSGYVLGYDGTSLTFVAPATGGGAGTVTSVGLTLPSIFAVSNSPITASGNLTAALNTQSAGAVFVGPSSGAAAAPTFRSLLATDLPNIPNAQVIGLAPSATTDTTIASNITSGTLPAGRLSGAYAGITGIGTLASGSVPASLVTGLAPSATTDTTIAGNITSGTLVSARLSGSYTGITGVGTLTAGTWNATAVGAAYGGTGLTSYNVGDTIYASGASTLTTVSGNTTTTRKYLAQTGTGSASAAPSWTQIGATDITGLAPSATTDTTIATNITSGSLSLARISITGASTNYVLTYNGSSVAWAAPSSASATGTVNNVVSTVPQRDATGALFRSQSIVQVAGTSTQSPAFTSSDTEYQLTAASATMTLNTYTPPTNNTYGIIRASSVGGAATSIITISPQNTSALNTPGSTGVGNTSAGYTTGTLASKSINATIKLTCTPQTTNNTANWTVESMTGVWYDNSNAVYITSSFVTADAYFGQASSGQVNSTLMMRDTTGSTAANNLTLGGYASLNKPLRITYNTSAPATVTATGQLWARNSDGQPVWVDGGGAQSQFLLTNALATHIAPVGSNTAPGVTFAGNTNIGMYIDASGYLGFTYAGVERLYITNTVQSLVPLSVTGTISNTTSISAGTALYAGTFVNVPAGTAAAPSVQVGGSTTGLYSTTANTLQISAGGTQVGVINSTSISFPNITSVSFASATAINLGAAVMTSTGSLQFPTGNNYVTCSTDTSQGLGFATNFLRLYGPGGNLSVLVGNNTSFYGVGIGVSPMSAANNALALAGACAYQETTQPTSASGFQTVFANATDHHLYANSPTFGAVCLTNGGRPVAKSTTSGTATYTVTLANGDNGRVWNVDGTYAGTATFNLPANSTTIDQYFTVIQTQATYGFVVQLASGTNVQFDTITGTAAGTITCNKLGAGFTLFLPKGKTTWQLLYFTGATAGTYTIS